VKKVVLGLLLIAVVGIFAVSPLGATYQKKVLALVVYSPCEKPVTYSIGVVDANFGLSRDQFLRDVIEAAGIWNKAYGKNLFTNDDSSNFTVNMVFDERQSLNNQINQLDSKLGSGKSTLDQKKAQYEKDAADFERRLSDLNSRIDHWNSQGGAPPDEYKKIVDDQNTLRTEAERLNQTAKDLNLSVTNYNADVGKLNKTIDTFNQDLNLKPEEGLFMGDKNRIEIYFNNGHDELVHTIAHELGHALGIFKFVCS
jgi:hypothetical protein